MKWNTQRKAAVLLLVLAGGAFLVDRFGIGYGPQSASGATPAPDTPAAITPVKTEEPVVAPRTVTIADKLKNVNPALFPEPADDVDSPDAFNIPASLLPPPPETKESSKPDARAEAAPTKPHEETTFNLTSVVRGVTPDDVWAHINGRLVRVGETIQGHRLDRVLRCVDGTTLAVLTGPEGAVRVRMKPETASTVPASDDTPTPKVSVRRPDPR